MDLTKVSWETVIVMLILIERAGEWVYRFVRGAKQSRNGANGKVHGYFHLSPCPELIKTQRELTEAINKNHLEVVKALGTHDTQLGILIVGVRNIEKTLRNGKSIIPDRIGE